MMKTDNLQLTSSNKPHYVALDGLRGVAAIVILVYHYMEMIYPDDYTLNSMAHGFLAVDFFFCLSGFVIGYAYDGRVEKIGIKSFFINRLIRLHPLVIVGSLIGLIGYICNPFIENPLASGWGFIILAFIFSMLLLPFPYVDYRGGGLFPYNTPAWSLFYEYIANIIYALVLVRIKRKYLIAICFLSAAWLVYCAYSAGWLIGGWEIRSIGDGFARVAFSFSAGLLVYRYNLIIKHKLGFIVPCLLLMAVFFYPHFHNDWITESILVVVVFPFILSIGAGAETTGLMQKMCDFIGRLSYPLYMTHITTVWIFGDYYNKYQPTGMKLVLIVAALSVINLLFAYIVMRWIDAPVRKWLMNKRKKRLTS